MNEKEFAELSAGHALDALSPEDERAYRAALAAHPEWADLAAADAQVVGYLSEGFGEEVPPVDVRAALLAQIAHMPQAGAPGAASVHPGVALSAPVAGVPVDAEPASVALPTAETTADAAPAATPDVPVAHAPVSAASVVSPETTPVPPTPDAADDDESTRGVPIADRPDAVVPPVPSVPAEQAADAEPVVSAAPPTEIVQTIQRKNWTRGLFALVASAALLVGVGWGVGSLVERARTPIEVQALEEIESAPDARSVVGQFADGGEATVHWSETVGKVVLTASTTPRIDEDRTFELWYVRGDEPIAAGTFEPGEDITALLEGEMEPGDTIAVTVEADGGSPDGTPTTDPIIAIPTNPGEL